MYQATVVAEPLTSEVALESGEPDTRSGGWGAVIVVPDGPKPKAASALFAFAVPPEIEKLAALGVFSVTAPPSIEEGVVVPVIESIADSRLPTDPVVGLIL